MSQCTADLRRDRTALGGFTCQHAPALIDLRNPLALENWTLPVLELMMVRAPRAWSTRSVGCAATGDPTNLALWFATVVYCSSSRVPLYFPQRLRRRGKLGVVFAHNVFTVQFLFGRLPLYIVALYPAVVTLAFEIVRMLGVFRASRGIVVGAVCVGFVHHASTRFRPARAAAALVGSGTSATRSTTRCWLPYR